MAHELAGGWPDRNDARGIEAVERAARPRIVRLGVARSPVDEIELRIVGAGPPRGSAALCPRVAVLRPGFGTRLAGRGDGVPPPQFLAGLRIPAVEEATRRELAAGHARDHDA